jgi:hypothetical protein
MELRRFERQALKAYKAKQWWLRKTPGQRRVRNEMHLQPELRWWLVYGPPRSGTSYVMRLIKTCSRLYVSDWGLGMFLARIPDWLQFRSHPVHDYITFDPDRLLQDISNNILDNAYAGDGDQLDLIYKQAGLRPKEIQTLSRMWGPPERVISCLREPAGYMASATKKFAQGSRERRQEVYVQSINSYLEVGGEVLEYTSELDLSDYLAFLAPLDFQGKRLPPFEYRGEQDHESVSAEMWAAYHRIKELVADG